MNAKFEDILRDVDLDHVLKWQKLDDQQSETIDDGEKQEPDSSTDEEEPVPEPD